MNIDNQLFVPVIKTEDGDVWTPSIAYSQSIAAYTTDSPNVNIVYKHIYEEADTVAWMGEYASMQAVSSKFPAQKNVLDNFVNAIEQVPDIKQIETIVYKISDNDNSWIQEVKEAGYLVNKSKSEYVSLKKWLTAPLCGMDPLPYLTAVSLIDAPMMGRWAFDNILFSAKKPKVCKEIRYDT